MMKYMGLALFVLLFGCTSLSKKDCETMNWQQKGKTDGAEGVERSAFRDYQKMCSEHRIMTDQKSYERGYSEGLKTFCTYDSGYDYGRDDKNYKGVCPQEIEADFIRGYRIGKKEYELARREAEIKKREEELRIQAKRNLLDGDEECTFDSDCRKVKPGSCSFGKCNGTGEKCSWDSDCKSNGRCESRSKYVDGSYVRVNACTYR